MGRNTGEGSGGLSALWGVMPASVSPFLCLHPFRCPHLLCEAGVTEGRRQGPTLSHHGQRAGRRAGRHLAGIAVSLGKERLLIEITNRSI